MAYDMLEGLYNNLQPKADVFAQLEAKLVEAEAMDKTAYTEESWAAVQDIIDSLERPVSKDNITEKLATKMLADLEKAIAALEVAPDPTITLEDGTYMVTTNNYGRPVASTIGESAKITAKDGVYTLTFYWSPERYRYTGGAYNDGEGYGDIISSAEDYTPYLVAVMKQDADESMKNGIPAKSALPGKDIQAAGFSDAVKAAVSDSYNDAYMDVRQETLADGTLAYSVDVTDLSTPIYLKALYQRDEHRNYGSNAGDKSSFLMSWGTFSLNADQAVALPSFPLTEVDSNVSFDFGAAGAGFNDPAAVAAVEDGKLKVTYKVSPAGLMTRYENSQEAWLLNDDDQIMALGDDGSFTLTYASVDDLVKGVKVQSRVYHKDAYKGNINDYSEITLRPDLNSKAVTITDAATGIQLLSNTHYLSESATLTATAVENTGSTDAQKDAYANMENYVGGVMNQMYFYTLSLQDGGKTVTDLGTSAILRFPIAEGMNKNALRMFWNYAENQGYGYGWLTNYGAIDGNYYTLNFKDWSGKDEIVGNFGFYDEKNTAATGEGLADGTYKVPITTFNASAPSQTSMSATCIGSEATLVVKDGVKRLELNFSPVDMDQLQGYLIQMWYTDTQGQEHELTYTSYYRNEDGSLFEDELNAGTGNYYPKTAWFILPSDEAQFMTRFRVSAMDAIMPGQDATREAIFTIYYDQAEKISDETPDAKPGEVLNPEVNKTALAAKLEEAKGLVTQTETYTAESLAALQTAIDAAQEIVDKADATQAEADAQTEALQAAIDTLVKNSGGATLDKDNLADGKYTVDIRMWHTNRNQYSMSDAAVNHTIDLEVVDGVYYATLDFQGMEITSLYGYLKELSYYADGYTYSDFGGAPVGERIDAEVLSTQKDADGKDVVDYYNDDNKDGVADYLYPDLLKIQIVPTAIKDPDGYVPLHVFVPIMDKILSGSGDQDALMKVDWSTLKAAEADKAALSIKLEAAKALVSQTDKYTAESLAALQTAINAAQAVADDAAATQEAVDAQVKALQDAVDALAEKPTEPTVDKEALDTQVEAGQEYLAQTGAYTAESLKALQAAIDAAQAVASNEKATQAEIDAAAQAVAQAIAGLVKIEEPAGVDKTGLANAVTAAKALAAQTDVYTAESLKALQAAIDAAQAILDKADATQDEVDAQSEALTQAVAALVKAEDPAAPNTGDNAGTGTLGGNKLPGQNSLSKNNSLNKSGNVGTGIDGEGAAAVTAGLLIVLAAGLGAYRRKQR
ncbi:MAG: NEAT domain-containing protein [Eubacterium sp.]|nr:NEAT domain-containing protein [Eubacterium sp.]